jgi:hypothetical protein
MRGLHAVERLTVYVLVI